MYHLQSSALVFLFVFLSFMFGPTFLTLDFQSLHKGRKSIIVCCFFLSAFTVLTFDLLVLLPSVPTLVLAGLCSAFTCCFVLFFNTRYRRLEAEEAATYGTTAPGCNNNTDNNDNAPSVDT